MRRGSATGCGRDRIHDWRNVHPHLRVTISIGVAQWDGAADATNLLEAADAQLYRAKRAGRNRVA